MHNLHNRLKIVQRQIQHYSSRYGRATNAVQLLAVSKNQTTDTIAHIHACGQRHFGESYAQEMAKKIGALSSLEDMKWHFIGPLQANKTKLVAEYADWLHSLTRAKIARRLNAQRPTHKTALQVLIQVNASAEESKNGVDFKSIPKLADEIAALSQLRLRGLMAIPLATTCFQQQRRAFALMREAREKLIQTGYELDTLSMGMSGDLEAAIAEGSTLVRVGNAIFGSRQTA